MTALNRSRQQDLFRPEQALSPVTVIGAGGIGSTLVLMLAKLGVPRIEVFDFDTVEEHNLASQLYRREDIGRPKVEALAEIAASFSDARIVAHAERYEAQPLEGIVIVAVDSMDARLKLWERIGWNAGVELCVDARMARNVAVVYAVRPCDPDDVRRYEKRLYPSTEATPVPCTARAVAYNTFGIASVVGATLRRWWLEGEATFEFRMDFESLTFI